MIRMDSENQIICATCGQKAYLREIVISDEKIARKISYETHQASIIEEAHISALLRAEAFYKKVFDLIMRFRALPEITKIVKIDDPPTGGVLTELDIMSHRPSACLVRTTITPQFTLKTFNKEFLVELPAREISSADLDQMMEEAREKAAAIIEDCRSNFILGL